MYFISIFLSSLPGACAQGLAWGIMALGVYLTFRILNISDLTVDGSLATGGAVCIALMTAGVNTGLAILAATASGMLAGLVTGLLHTKCGLPAILAGILTQLSLYSINLRIMGGRANLPISVDKYRLLVSQRFVRNLAPSNPIIVFVILITALILLLYWFFGTELGSSIRATGNNVNMAKAQGINTNKNIVLGISVANGMVALAGALIAQYQGSADVNMGRGAIVIGLAAVIIGEVVFGKLFANFSLKMASVVIGAVIYYVVLQIVLTMGLNTNDLKLISAAIVAVFLAIPYFKANMKKGGRKNA